MGGVTGYDKMNGSQSLLPKCKIKSAYDEISV